MATVAFVLGSYPGAGKVRVYIIDQVVNGSQTITLPAPPLAGSFDPSGLETPTFVKLFPYATAAIGPKMTVDPVTIANSSGTISFTLQSDGNGKCRAEVS